MIYRAKTFSLLKSHLLLVTVGLGCEILYLIYLIRQFPLLSYYQDLRDIGGITGHSYSGFTMFVVVLTMLFALFGVALWEIYTTRRGQNTLRLILGFGVLFTLTTVFVYPGTAIDIFSYIAQSLILIQHHANPMITPAASFPDDPMMGLAGGLGSRATPYGPLGILIDAIPTLIVGRNLLANLLLLKFMFSTMLLIEAYLAYKILASYAPEFALVGSLFIAWNPYMLFEYSANGHNDVVFMLFVLLAILALVKDCPVLAFALIIASVLIKYTTLPLAPLFFIHSIIYQPNNRKRLLYLLKIAVTSILLVALIYGPFWSGTHTIDSLLSEDQSYISSFSTMLFEILPTHIPLSQGRLLGQVTFAFFYLYALFLSTRDRPAMLRGCFIALFFFLAFATPKFQIWYIGWPAMLAVLIPRIDKLLAAFLFTYGASLSNCVYQFLFTMMGASGDAFMFSNDLAYLITFMPSLLLLFCFTLRWISSPSVQHGTNRMMQTL
jgi:hypothetical protein